MAFDLLFRCSVLNHHLPCFAGVSGQIRVRFGAPSIAEGAESVLWDITPIILAVETHRGFDSSEDRRRADFFLTARH